MTPLAWIWVAVCAVAAALAFLPKRARSIADEETLVRPVRDQVVEVARQLEREVALSAQIIEYYSGGAEITPHTLEYLALTSSQRLEAQKRLRRKTPPVNSRMTWLKRVEWQEITTDLSAAPRVSPWRFYARHWALGGRAMITREDIARRENQAARIAHAIAELRAFVGFVEGRELQQRLARY